jgi:hypothetical protein
MLSYWPGIGSRVQNSRAKEYPTLYLLRYRGAIIEKMRWQPVRRGNRAPYFEGSILKKFVKKTAQLQLKPAIGSREKSKYLVT